MRTKNDLTDIDDYFVKVTRQNPVSEEHVPMREFRVILGGLSDAPAVPAPVPAVPDAGTQAAMQQLSEDLARARAEIAELRARPVPMPVDLGPILARLQMLENAPKVEAAPLHTAAQPSTDLPAFMQRAAAAAGLQPVEQPDTGVDRAVEIMHEIERGVMDALQRLADRLSMVEQRLDIEARPHEPVGATAVQDLAAYLRALDQRVSEADAHARAAEDEARRAVASRAAIPQPEAKRPPATLAEAKADALDRVRAAAKARRDTMIGATADERDCLMRMATEAFDGLVGNREAAIVRLERIASVSGERWDVAAKGFAAATDLATEVIVATLALERRAAALIGRADVLTPAAIEQTVAEVIEAINKVGE